MKSTDQLNFESMTKKELRKAKRQLKFELRQEKLKDPKYRRMRVIRLICVVGVLIILTAIFGLILEMNGYS